MGDCGKIDNKNFVRKSWILYDFCFFLSVLFFDVPADVLSFYASITLMNQQVVRT